MSSSVRRLLAFGLFAASAAFFGCTGSVGQDNDTGVGGGAGSGTGGGAGGDAGQGGTTASAGQAGTSTSAGRGGASAGAGQGGTAASAGRGGTTASAGRGGTTASAGRGGGTAGTGQGGSAGTGRGGAGTAGQGGSVGTAGQGGSVGTGAGGTGTGGSVGTGRGGSAAGGQAGTTVTGTAGAAGSLSSTKFPLKISADGRRLLDVSGAPFLVQGDAAWALIAAADQTMAETYLEDRRQKGFNAAIVMLLDHKFAPKAPADVYGNAPFTTPGDFSTPNEAYFAHVDWTIQRANEKGIMLLLFPAYTGYGGGDEGWYQEMTANGVTKLRNYGRYLGARYKSYPNILWVDAGDYDPPTPDLVRAVAQGILDNDQVHYHTAHCGRTNSAMDCFANETWLSVNSSYTNFITYSQVLKDYNRTPFKPFFLLDAQYENENESTRTTLRSQAYWAILSGAQGQDFGNNPVWGFQGPTVYPPPHSWDTGLQDPGAKDMTKVSGLFASLRWSDLIPDQTHATLTAGYGTATTNPGAIDNDYATAARTADGRLVVVYAPSTGTGTRALTIAMSQLAGPANARWYNPTSGAFTAVSGGPFTNSGSHVFTTPGDNGTGANDWALLIEVP